MSLPRRKEHIAPNQDNSCNLDWVLMSMCDSHNRGEVTRNMRQEGVVFVLLGECLLGALPFY